jgi:heme-degrading monooxygenase HmoA
MDEFIHAFEAYTEQLKGIIGFVGTQLLTDRTANKGMIVTLYETLTDLQASEPFFRQALADPKFAALSAGPPVVAVYEVAAQATRAANT